MHAVLRTGKERVRESWLEFEQPRPGSEASGKTRPGSEPCAAAQKARVAGLAAPSNKPGVPGKKPGRSSAQLGAPGKKPAQPSPELGVPGKKLGQPGKKLGAAGKKL